MSTDFNSFGNSFGSSSTGRASLDGSKLRKVSPIGMRVVVRIRQDDNQTESGLFLPEGSKESMDESLLGEVLEVATAVDDDLDEDANISGIPLGALVLIEKNSGVKVPWDDNLRIVETHDILALVHEVDIV